MSGRKYLSRGREVPVVSRRSPISPALLAVLGLLVVASLATPALASSPPQVVCGACGEQFARAAADVDIEVTVVESTADVRLHANGTATWTARTRVTPDSAHRLRNATVGVRALARASLTTYPNGPAENPQGLDARLDGNTVVVTFTDAAPLKHAFGTTLLEYFDTDGTDRSFEMNVDRLSVLTPEGTRVTNMPEASVVDDRNVTWYGNATEFSDTRYLTHGEGRIVFAPPDRSNPGIRTTATLWADTLPIYLDNLRGYVLPSTLLFGVLVGMGLGGVRGTGRDRASGLGRGLFAVGLAVALGSLTLQLVGRMPAVGVTVAGAALVAVLGWVAVARPDRYRAARPAARVGLVALAGVLIAVLPVIVAFAPPFAPPLPVILGTLWLQLLPVALAPAAGVLASRAHVRSFALGWALLVGAVALAGAGFVPIEYRPFGALIVFMLMSAIVAAVVVTPLAALGAGLARD